jgi:hypothetical protein
MSLLTTFYSECNKKVSFEESGDVWDNCSTTELHRHKEPVAGLEPAANCLDLEGKPSISSKEQSRYYFEIVASTTAIFLERMIESPALGLYCIQATHDAHETRIEPTAFVSAITACLNLIIVAELGARRYGIPPRILGWIFVIPTFARWAFVLINRHDLFAIEP